MKAFLRRLHAPILMSCAGLTLSACSTYNSRPPVPELPAPLQECAMRALPIEIAPGPKSRAESYELALRLRASELAKTHCVADFWAFYDDLLYMER